MTTMDQLIDPMRRERQILLDAMAGLPDTALDQKGTVGGWSIKNVLAHLTDWESIVVQILPDRLATGIRPEILNEIGADEDAWNARQVAEREHLSPQQQLQEFTRTREALYQVLRTEGEEVLNRQHPWPQWEGTLAEYILDQIGDHEREHREGVLLAAERLRQSTNS